MAVRNVVAIRDGEPVGALMSLLLDGVPCLAARHGRPPGRANANLLL